MAWSPVANIKGPPGGGASVPTLITPADGWATWATPARWDSASTINVAGGAPPDLISGSFVIPYPDSASLRNSLHRVSAASAAAASSYLDAAISPNKIWRGNAAGRGGFVYKTRLSVTSTVSTQRGFFGLYNSYAAIGASGTVTSNALGLYFDRAVDSNYQIMCHGTKIDLGAGFPLNDTAAVLDVEFRAAPNDTKITYLVKDMNSGATASGTISSGLFPNTTFLALRAYMTNGGTAAAVSCDVMLIYASSYWSA